MNLVFIELMAFSKYRAEHLTDEEYRALQNELLLNPEKGDIIQGINGLRKLRIADSQRNKGKRGGARVIYYYFANRNKLYFFTAYGKNKQTDLTNDQKQLLKWWAEYIKKYEEMNNDYYII